jgi:hypothetical protein
MIRTLVILSLTASLFFVCSGEQVVAADAIHITSASYGRPNLSKTVTEDMRQRCEGKSVCEGLLVNMFPDIAFGQVKELNVTYTCGLVAAKAQIKDGMSWRLSCPPGKQPSYRADFRLVRDKSCDREEGPPEVLKIPEGYRYCWHKKIDYKTDRARSDASLTFNSKGEKDGITVTWETTPSCGGLLKNKTSVDHLWTLMGALPGESCPPQ